jgi:hypothetical protein
MKPFLNVPIRSNHNFRNKLTEALEYLKINVKCHDKFIPKIYKHGSIQQRIVIDQYSLKDYVFLELIIKINLKI